MYFNYPGRSTAQLPDLFTFSNIFNVCNPATKRNKRFNLSIEYCALNIEH